MALYSGEAANYIGTRRDGRFSAILQTAAIISFFGMVSPSVYWSETRIPEFRVATALKPESSGTLIGNVPRIWKYEISLPLWSMRKYSLSFL